MARVQPAQHHLRILLHQDGLRVLRQRHVRERRPQSRLALRREVKGPARGVLRGAGREPLPARGVARVHGTGAVRQKGAARVLRRDDQ